MFYDMVESTSERLTTSPVFPCRHLSGQQSIGDSSSKHGPKFKETNYSSGGASPWLSKESGISNANSTVKTGAHSGYELL